MRLDFLKKIDSHRRTPSSPARMPSTNLDRIAFACPSDDYFQAQSNTDENLNASSLWSIAIFRKLQSAFGAADDSPPVVPRAAFVISFAKSMSGNPEQVAVIVAFVSRPPGYSNRSIGIEVEIRHPRVERQFTERQTRTNDLKKLIDSIPNLYVVSDPIFSTGEIIVR